MKKIFAWITVFVMTVLMSAECFAYLPGDKTMKIDLSDYAKLIGAEANEASLSLSAGGKAVYDVYIPFNAVQITFTSSLYDSANLKMYIDDTLYEIALTALNTSYSFEKIVRKGEHRITLVSDADMKLHLIELLKEDVPVASRTINVAPALSDFEKAVQTAIILHENSPVIMVNGGRRYINNDNIRQLPYIVNGEAYLPLHSFARAFGYYYEKTDDTLLLSKENKIFMLKNGVLTKKENAGEHKVIDNVIIENENGVYVPVKYFSEVEGKTVTKQDGFYIIEYPSAARLIVKKQFEGLKEFYSNLYLEEQKGNTYYVCQSCNANDENDGSKEHPFRTISKAAEIAQAGDTVIIGEGVYYELLAPKNDGTVTNPITFKAAEGADVELAATELLGDPIEKLDNGILVYKALTDLGDGRNQLFYKNDILVAGRHPNTHTSSRGLPEIENLSPVWPTQGNIRVTLEDKHVAVSDTDLKQEADYWKGGTFVVLTGNGWTLGTAKIESSEAGKLYLTDTGKMWFFDAIEAHTETDFGYITDHKNTIDMPGEWAYEDGKIYILPPEGETAETLEIEQKIHQLAIDIADRKHIIIEGIDTYGGGMKMNNSEMCMLRDGTYRYVSHYTHGKDQREGFIENHDTYNPDGAPPRGEMGIYLGGRDNIILNNHIAYSAAAGIYAVGCYEYIENNIISDCGYMASYVGGLFVGTEAWKEIGTPRGGNAIFENSVYNSGRYIYGISTNNEWYGSGLPPFLPDEVAYNEFYNGAIASRDVGTMYSHGASMGTDRLKSKFHHNVIYDAWTMDSSSVGVYYDNWMNGAECYENLVFCSHESIYANRIPYSYQAKGQFPVTYALVESWNNMSPAYVVKGGKEALKEEDYPNGRKFNFGAKSHQWQVDPMIQSLSDESEWITPDMMAYSEGVNHENGQLVPSNAGDWICIENADFSGGKNLLKIDFSGDIYNTDDKIQVYVGESPENYITTAIVELTTTAPSLTGNQVEDVFVHGADGNQKIWIKFKDYKSAAINRIRLTSGYDPYQFISNVFASDCTIVKAVNGTNNGGFTSDDMVHYFINATWPGTTLLAEDVVIKEDSDTMLVKLASNPDNNGETIEFRLGSATGEVICKYKVTETDWRDWTGNTVKLERVLEKGTYDIYVVFTGTGTTNFYSFGFFSGEE